MIQKIKILVGSEVGQYIIYGALTTLINIGTYFLCSQMGINYVYSNILAFIISVIFAFGTNKIFVFKCTVWKLNIVCRECIVFFTARIGTFFIDMLLMIILVQYIQFSEFGSKCIVNIMVIIMNYVISKIVIFTKND